MPLLGLCSRRNPAANVKLLTASPAAATLIDTACRHWAVTDLRVKFEPAQGPNWDGGVVWNVDVTTAEAPKSYGRGTGGRDCDILPTFTAVETGGAKRRRGLLGKRLRRKRKACEHERDEKYWGCFLELNQWIHMVLISFSSLVDSGIEGP